MKNIFFLETIVFFIGGFILSVLADNYIILAAAFGFNFFLAVIQSIGAELVFMGEETPVKTKKEKEDFSAYRSAHSL